MTNTTLLTYAVGTDPEPLQVSPATGDPSRGALTIVVSNGGSEPVYCTKIVFEVPVGELAQDLTDVPTGILSAATPSEAWRIAETGTGVFTATPATSPAEIAAEGLVFQIYNVVVNEQVGTFKLEVQETASLTDAGFTAREASFEVAKFPYGFFFGNLAPSAPQVAYGREATLTWSGSDGPEYVLLWGGSTANVTERRSFTTRLTDTTTFLLQATLHEAGKTVVAYQSTTVVVAEPALVANELTVRGSSTLAGALTVGSTTTPASATVDGRLEATSLGAATGTIGALTVSGGLKANTGPVTALGAETGIHEGRYVAHTDGLVVAWVANPTQENRMALSRAMIKIVAQTTIWICGGNVACTESGGEIWSGPDPQTGMLPVRAGETWELLVQQDAHNQVAPTTEAWFYPLGTPSNGVAFERLGDAATATDPVAFAVRR